MKKNRLFSVRMILALVFVFTLVAVAATALADTLYSGPYTILTNNTQGTARITAWKGDPVTELTVPGELLGYRIISISDNVFKGSGITKLNLPENLSSVGTVDSTTTIWCPANCNTATAVNSFISPSNTSYRIKRSGDNITIVAYLGNAASVTIPASIDGIKVTAIGAEAFKDNTTLQSVTIPGGVVSIGSSAFYKCTGLSSASLPNTLSTIDSSAFRYCSALDSVSIPASVTTLGNYCFRNTGIMEVTLPDGITTYNKYETYYPFETSVLITCNGGTKTSSRVPKFISPSAKDYLVSESGGELTILEYRGTESSVSIPGQIDGVTVTKIGEKAFFENAVIQSVVIPDSVIIINGSAFYKCTSLSSVKLSDSLTTIGGSAFRYCSALKSIDIPSTVTVLDNYCFRNTGIETVTLPDGITSYKTSSYDPFESSVILTCHADSKTAALVSKFSSPSEPDYVVRLSNGSLTIAQYIGPVAEFDVPTVIDGITVSGTDKNAFPSGMLFDPDTFKVRLSVGLESVEFSALQATVNQKVTITAVTNTYADSLNMYSGKNVAKTWTTGYKEEDGRRIWTVDFEFTSAGSNKKMGFRAVDAKGNLSDEKTATITITAAPTMSSVAFSRNTATVKQELTIKASTSTSATELQMYLGEKLVKKWTSGFTDSGNTRTWVVPYSFSGAGDRTLTFKMLDENGALTTGKSAAIKITPAPKLTSAKFSREQATVKQDITIKVKTNSYVDQLNMYSGKTLAKSWTEGYSDTDDGRIWEVTFAFASKGSNRKLTFKGVDANGVMTDGKDAYITITAAPKLSSAEFVKDKATVKQKVTITAVTSTNVTALNMYSGKKLAKSWTSGYTDKDSKRTWKVTLTFSTTGANRKMTFKGQDANGAETAGLDDYITITAAPTLSGVKFAKEKVPVKQSVTIKAVTNTMATKLTMIYNGKAVKSWTSGYTDADGKRTWKVTYTFTGKGTKTLSFKAYDANGAATAEKKATITVTAAEKPVLSSVKFAVTTAKVKEKVTIKAVTSTNVTQLNMYSGTKLVKSWTKGYTDKDGKRTWKVTYTFGGAGANRKLTFKGQDANGTLSAGKDATITITK